MIFFSAARVITYFTLQSSVQPPPTPSSLPQVYLCHTLPFLPFLSSPPPLSLSATPLPPYLFSPPSQSSELTPFQLPPPSIYLSAPSSLPLPPIPNSLHTLQPPSSTSFLSFLPPTPPHSHSMPKSQHSFTSPDPRHISCVS